MPVRRRTLTTVVVAVVTVALVVAALAGLAVRYGHRGQPFVAVSPAASPVPSVTFPSSAPEPQSQIRNVVLVLADDMDWKLWREIPRLAALQAQGTTFTNYVVSESLCCPSRTTIFRGQYVHNHRVISNTVETGGGWPTFRNDGYPQDCLPVWLHDAGVTTGLVGKYLNQYPETPAEQTLVPPGWDTFVVPASRAAPYGGYDYLLNVNGTIVKHGSKPTNYIGDVINAQAAKFLRDATKAPSPGTPSAPFFLELATFAPHLPAPVAPRHIGSHAGSRAPRDPAFNTLVTNPPSWLAPVSALDPTAIADIDATWRQRAESAESVADSVDTVMAELKASGHLNDTLVIVTSDNGFHAGSYGIPRGKRTAFDTDTVVPMVAIGPGVPAGKVVDDMVSETDLGPTITAAMGAHAPDWVDGRSMLPLLSMSSAPTGQWRTGVLTENVGDSQPGDPDFQLLAPHHFEALLTRQWLYVRSGSGELELYDRIRDPYELDNIAGTAPGALLDALNAQLNALVACAGATCRQADAMTVPAMP